MLRLIGWIFRLLAWACVAAGVGLLFYALLPMFRENQPFKPEPLGKIWSDIHQESLLLLQPAIERHISPWLWSSIVQPILEAPAFVVFLIFGLILWFLTARRRDRKKTPDDAHNW